MIRTSHDGNSIHSYSKIMAERSWSGLRTLNGRGVVNRRMENIYKTVSLCDSCTIQIECEDVFHTTIVTYARYALVVNHNGLLKITRQMLESALTRTMERWMDSVSVVV